MLVEAELLGESTLKGVHLEMMSWRMPLLVANNKYYEVHVQAM